MAIAQNDIITYNELKDKFFDWLKTSCVNMTGVSATIPDYFKENYEKIFPLEYVAVADHNGDRTIGTMKAHVKIDNDTLPEQTVTLNEISKDFDDFMAARDIDIKTNKAITTRGVINFWNNVASFCSLNIIFVTGQEVNESHNATKTLRYYQKSPRNGQQIDINKYPRVPVVDEEEKIVSTDVVQMLNNLEETINTTSKTHQLLYNITMECSSCSSCSSSSSSSSAFIVYMKL